MRTINELRNLLEEIDEVLSLNVRQTGLVAGKNTITLLSKDK